MLFDHAQENLVVDWINSILQHIPDSEELGGVTLLAMFWSIILTRFYPADVTLTERIYNTKKSPSRTRILVVEKHMVRRRQDQRGGGGNAK